MYRRLPALALAALLGATAACGRTGELTGPEAPLYDGVVDDGGMFGNGNIAGDASGGETTTLDENGGTLGSGGVVAGDGGPSFDNGGMFGNGN